MNRYSARALANLSETQIWALPDEPITIDFDDGEMVTHARHTIFSWFCWKIVRKYPKTPMLKRHHIGDTVLTATTTLDLLNAVLWDCYDEYAHSIDLEVADMRKRGADNDSIYDVNQYKRLNFIEDLCLLSYQATNELYNSLSYELEEYATTLNILDMIDILDHPEVKAANESALPTQESITETHNKIKAVLVSPTAMPNNALVKAMRGGLVNTGQILQCVSPVGFRTDIDSNIFPHPIMTGFVEGVSTLHDHAIESRSASKAAMLTKDPLRVAEYFNRKLQLLTATVKRVHIGDCGSSVLMPFKVQKKDLFSLAGKYYLADDQLIPVKKTDYHLVGKIIHYRSSLYCRDRGIGGVCSTCFGQLAESIPRDTTLGHVCGVVFNGKTTQNIMSTKHLDGSAEVDDIVLTDIMKRFITLGKRDNNIFLSSRLKNKQVYMTVLASEAEGLVDLGYTDKIHALSIHNLTALSEVLLTVSDNKLTESQPVAVSRDNRKAALTHEALIFIKKRGWVLTEDNRYTIDLTDWPTDKPLFRMPLKHLNTFDYVKSVEAKIIGLGTKDKNGIDMRPLSGYDNAEEALMGLYELIDTKLKVNIAHLEIIVLASTIKSTYPADHSVGEEGDKFISAKYSDNIAKRSLSGQLAYQQQRSVLFSPSVFNVGYRPPHVLDDFLCP